MLNKNCAFAEKIVAYIYDEATAKERVEFEKHILGCMNCADEIAGFGLVRSSINEWRKAEFLTLQSPALDIPISPQTVSSEKVSWLGELRKTFTFSPAFAAGFAVLLISIGLVWMFFTDSSKDFALDNLNEVQPVSEAKETPQPKEEQVSNPLPDEKINEVPQQIKILEQKSFAPKNQTVRASNVTPKLKTSPKLDNSMAQKNRNLLKNNKTGNVQSRDIPTLSGMSDDDDKSLRLSELFAEIGTD